MRRAVLFHNSHTNTHKYVQKRYKEFYSCFLKIIFDKQVDMLRAAVKKYRHINNICEIVVKNITASNSIIK